MKKFLMVLVGLAFTLDAFAFAWHDSKKYGCAPEVQRQTLQNAVDTVGALLESDIFEEQDRLKDRFTTIARMNNDNRQKNAFLGLVGVSPESGEGLLVAYSRFMGARSYSAYIDAIEKNVGISLTPIQRQEISSVFEHLRGDLE